MNATKIRHYEAKHQSYVEHWNSEISTNKSEIK